MRKFTLWESNMTCRGATEETQKQGEKINAKDKDFLFATMHENGYFDES